MTTSTRDTIISYLGAGVSQAVAAEAAGVDPSYVSQLLLVPGVQEEIALKRALRLEKHLEIDASIESAEMAALKKTAALIPYIRNASEGAKVFTALNAARKKATLENGRGDGTGTNIVQITLPAAAKIMIATSTDNQIVEVDGRSIAPLPSKALPLLAARLSNTPKEIPAPEPVHVAEIKEKARQLDESRARQVLADITTVIDGVTVVL